MPTHAIVIPCYNEAERLDSVAFLGFLDTHPGYAICLVDDGSSDGTVEIMEKMRGSNPDQVIVLTNPQNLGKAGTVRHGMLECAKMDFEYISFLDADLATPFSEIPRITQEMIQQYGADIAFGARVVRMGAAIDRTRSRHYFGRVFSSVADFFLGVECYDSQCGAKTFHRDTILTLFTDEFVSKWFFDLELVIRGQRAGYKQVEIPLKSWREVSGSRLKVKDFIMTPVHIWKIRKRYGKLKRIVN